MLKPSTSDQYLGKQQQERTVDLDVAFVVQVSAYADNLDHFLAILDRVVEVASNFLFCLLKILGC